MKHLLPLPASWPVLPLLAGLLLTGGCDDRPVAPPPAAAGQTAAAPRPAAPATTAPDAARPTPTDDDTPARHETSPPGPQHSASPRQAPAGMPSTARPSPDPSGSRIDDALAARILQARQCSGCHQRDRKVVGPSWRQIRDRLATLPDAPARLRNSIRQGSRGQWGPLSMPPQPQLAPAEADVVVSWILQSHP